MATQGRSATPLSLGGTLVTIANGLGIALPEMREMIDDAALVELILGHLHREFPHKSGHVLGAAADVARPRDAYPAFHGSFDWHSSVHSHWALARLVRAHAGAPWRERALDALEQSFAADRLAAEGFQLARAERRGFEMPYGIAWLLTLWAELAAAPAHEWAARLSPVGELAATRFADWLELLPAPNRSGEHSQSALAMSLALDAADALGEGGLAATIGARAVDFYSDDRDAPLDYEPSAYDFVSPALAEADLMRRVLGADFADWLGVFLPEVSLAPVEPSDRSDGKLAHWDGLNLSRAWMLRGIAGALADRPRRRDLESLGDAHAAAGLAAISTATYAGTHWLPSFAVYLNHGAVAGLGPES